MISYFNPTSLLKVGIFIFLSFGVNLVSRAQNTYQLLMINESDKLPLIYQVIKINNISYATDSIGMVQWTSNHQNSIVTVGIEQYKMLTLDLDTMKNSPIRIEMKALDFLLDEVSVVSSKYEKSIIQEVNSIEVLRPQSVVSNNLVSLEQAIDRVPGIQMIDGQVNIRGGAGYSYGVGGRVLLLVDDVPAMQADAAFPNWGDIPIENVARIEVLKGSGSVLYGSSALNGVINFKTGYAGIKPLTKVRTTFTGFLSPKDKSKKWWKKMPFESNTNIVHSRRINKSEIVVGANYKFNDSYNKDEYDRSFRSFAYLKFNLAPQWFLNINGLLNVGETNSFIYWVDDSTGAYIGTPATYSKNKKLRYYLDPVLTWYAPNSQQHQLLGRYYFVNNSNNTDQSQKSTMTYLEYKYKKNWHDLDMHLTSGVVFTNTFVDAELYNDTIFKTNNAAAYAQIDKVLWSKLSINAGLRYEYNNAFVPRIIGADTLDTNKENESRPVFKLGANYKIHDAMSVRASWGQGYRYPSVAEKFVNTTSGAIRISPNPFLKSENGWSAEIGIRTGFKNDKLKGYFDLALFRTDYDRMTEFIIQDLLKGFQSINIGNTTIKGIDFSTHLSINIAGGTLQFTAGYTFNDPKYRNFSEIDTLKSTVNYNILKYRMKHNVKGDIEFHKHGWLVGASYFYNSNMVAIDKIFDVVIPGVHHFREEHQNGAHVLNIKCGKTIRNWNMVVNFNNILNTEYSFRPGLLEAPQNISLSLELKI